MQDAATSPPGPQPPDEWRQHFRAGAPPLPPAAQLLAEHHVMRAVLAAMEATARALRAGEPLDLDFWGDVVDFIGNFVHRCHCAKEERLFYPRVVAAGLLPQRRVEALTSEHANAGRLTADLCELASAGDWEGVVRLVAIYLHLMLPHMRHEEDDLGQAPLLAMEAGLAAELAAVFRAEEERALGAGGVGGVLELAQRLCQRAGLATLDA